MQAIKRNLPKLTIAFLLVAALFCSGLNRSVAYAAPCTADTFIELWAKTGTATLYTGGPTVTIWGYSLTAGDPATLPGPVLEVNQGNCVQVTLHNTLAESSALLFQGQSLIPDTTGAAAGADAVYTFAASNPGAFLYEAGLIPGMQHQVAMGLYGALIVQPTVPTAVDVEKTLVLSEFDATLAANPIGYDMRKYAPRYFLINGKAYPDTDLLANQISVAAGNSVLLRYVNAGLQAHAMSTLGVAQKVIAMDGSAFAHPHSMVSETIAPGQTLDALVTIPASATVGTKYALYDANLLLRNANASGLGGMLTFLTVVEDTSGSGTDTTGPLLSSLTLAPNPSNGAVSVALSFTANDTTTGNSNVTAAEYWIDGNVTHTSIPVGSPAPVVTLNDTIGAGLSHGTHVVSVRAQDSSLNWSTTANINLVVDSVAPTTSGLSLTPNPSNGSVSVTFSFTGNDSASGNSNITAAEYWIDAGAHQSLSVASPAPVKILNVSLLPPFSAGTHTVSARTQDALGNWSMPASINLVVDQTAPVTSGVSASPNPNNGAKPYNTSVPAVRVFASFSDVASGNSNIATAEGFIDTVGTTGTGFVFVATDGNFNSPAEGGYADIPLAVVNALSAGNHTIYVRAKDAAGNWGTTATAVPALLIDKTAPTFTSITLTPNTILAGTASVSLAVNGAADTGGAGVAGGEYWINPPTTTTPAPGSGTQFSGLTANIPVGSLAIGTYTVSARIRDAAGNWSTGTNGIRSATLTVVPDAIFSNGFETGTTPWGWSSASTNSATRLNVTTTPALVGTRSLQAQGSNTNYVQFNFGTAAQPATATFDARFYFRPNGNNSTGKDILSAATSSTFGTTAFRVRYRLNVTTPQVQIQVGTANTNTTWTNLLGGTSNNYIEVVWQSGSTLQLYVNGILSQTLTAGANSVGAVRLGSVTNTGNATLMYFDAFASKRTVSPLIGP